MKEIFLQIANSNEIPTYHEERETIIDESQVNGVFEPANDFFYDLREAGEWAYYFVSDSITQVLHHFM